MRCVTQRIRARDELAQAVTADLAPDFALFETRQVTEDWDRVRTELIDLFELSRAAAIDEIPVVYVVSSDALLGREGPGNAMVATGALSAARTLAAEMRKSGVPVNVIGTSVETPTIVVASWVRALATGGPDGPTGELVQLGGTQIGKALS